MNFLKSIVCLMLFGALVAGCSSHANYVVSEPGYKDNDKLIGLLNAAPVDVKTLYPNLKPVKLVKPAKPVSLPAVTAQTTIVPIVGADPSGVVTIYGSEGKQVLFDREEWNAIKQLFPDIKKEAEASRNGRSDYKLVLFQIEPFVFDSAALDPAKLEKRVSTIISVIKDKHLKPFVVMGYADPVGPKAYNKGLSGKRAEAVIAELEKSNFGGIRTVALGSTDQFAGNAGGNKQKNGPNRTVWIACFE